MKKFNVYFAQVNQTKFEVQAQDQEAAIKKAAALWKEHNGKPSGRYVEELPSEGKNG